MLFGRDREVEQIVGHCRAGRLTVVVSHPGLGATALLTRGLAPALRAEGFIVVTFSGWQGQRFAERLTDAVVEGVQAQTGDGFGAEGEPLPALLRRARLTTGRTVALLFDQFEDYLRCHFSTALSDGFDADICHAVTARDCQVVVALQEHGVQAFQRFGQYLPNLMGASLTLGPLDASAAREVAAGVAREEGVELESGTIEALVTAKVAQYGNGVHPYYLMAGVRRAIDAGNATGMARVGPATIGVFGGADRMILESVDSQLSRLNVNQTDLFFRWCGLLISKDGERLAVSAEALTEFSGRMNRFAMSLIPLLTEEGILRAVEMPGTLRYEIARDSLTPMIQDWWLRREAVVLASRRSKFRVRSLSVAVGALVALYVVWLFWSMK